MALSIVKFFHKIVFIKAVHHVRETILCPHSDHLSFFFSVTASLFLCYSFFLSSHHGTKSHTVVIIIFYATNDFSSFFFLNFRIISKSILHNHSNSIRKLNYDRRNWANTFLFFFFSSCLFLCFFLELSCVASFFSFLFTPSFFFFWGCAVLLFSVLDIFLFLSGGRRICSSCFWSLFLVYYFLGPCVFSISPSIAWTSRSEIDSSLFLAASLIVFVEPW